MTPPGRRVAWCALAVGLADVIWRQLTNAALLEAGVGFAWSVWWTLAAMGAVAAWLAVAAPAPRARRLTLFLTLVAAGSVAQGYLGARLQGTALHDLACARSIWFDRDTDLSNDHELLRSYGIEPPRQAGPSVADPAQTTCALAPALLWSPFLAVGHGAALWTTSRRPDAAANGASFPYRQAVCLAGLVYGLAGLFASAGIARTVFPARAAASAAVAVGAGSFVLWYLVREPGASHGPSVAAVSLVVLGWLRTPPGAPLRAWAVLGLTGAAMTALRGENAIVLLLPAATLLSTAIRTPRAGMGGAFVRLFALVAPAVVGLVLQMPASRPIDPRGMALSPAGPLMATTGPDVADVLWSSRNGLLATSPVLYLAAIGLAPLWRRDRRLSAAGLVVFAWLISTVVTERSWGTGYGGRQFDGMVPFFTVGLAAFAAALAEGVRRRPGAAAGALLGLLVVWNASLMIVARRGGTYRIGQPVSFGDVGAAQAEALHGALGHLPSYPANLVYASRNRVAPARYDLLGPMRFPADPAGPYGHIDVGGADGVYLTSGWHQPERSGEVSFRWARREAGLLVPLDHPAPLRVQIRLRPFVYQDSAPQQLTVAVNGAALPAGVLPPSWTVVDLDAPAPLWRQGVNRVRLRFSRETRPSAVGGRDDRPLAAAVDYLRVRVSSGD